MKPRTAHQLALAALVLVVILPFLNRAIYIDEHIFIKISTNALITPLYPQDVPTVFFGVPVPDLGSHTHPPVVEYYLALLIRLFGIDSEAPLRLGFSIFGVLAILAFYRLAERWTEHPFEVSLIMTCCPAFVMMAPTIMMDVPMLALTLTGAALYFAHLDGTKHALLASAVAFTGALGSGYTVVVPLFCLGVMMLAAGRPRKEVAALLCAPGVVGLWLVLMTIHYGRFPLTATVAFFATQGSMWMNTLATIAFLGGLTMVPFGILLLQRFSAREALVAVVIGLLLAAIEPGPTWMYTVWFAALLVAGLLTLRAFGTQASRLMKAHENHGEAFLLLWAPLVLLFFIVVGDMVNGRYLLLAMPAVLLIALRTAPAGSLRIVAGASLALSLTLSAADTEFVNSYRTYVRNVVRPAQSEGFRVWSAAESGLRFYLEREGAKTLARVDLDPRGMDLIVRPAGLFRYGLHEEVETMLTVLQSDHLTGGIPIRTYNARARAGFHDSRIGLVPYVWSRAPHDTVEMAQMHPLTGPLPQPPPERAERPVWSPEGPVVIQRSPELVFPLRIPTGARLEYEVADGASLQQEEDRIVLKHLHEGSVAWKHMRVMPRSLLQH